MASRGRPPHPDILTPREREVLALLREGLSNEEIARRLGVTLAGAKYHVSEILGKLGVSTREEAARWRETERPWWSTAVAPVAFFWRRTNAGWLSQATTAALVVGVAAGASLLAWGLVRTEGGESVSNAGAGLSVPNAISPPSVQALPPTPTLAPAPTFTPDPLTPFMGVYVVSRDGGELRHLVPGEVFHADLAPDGSEVLYQADGRIVATHVATGATRVVIDPPAGGFVWGASWSATGRYVTYVREGDNGPRGVWIARRDGSEARVLFTAGEAGGRLSIMDWLPDDSAAFAFSSVPVDPGTSLVRVTPDGDISEPLASDIDLCGCGGGGAYRVVVSPDGSRVAFSDHTGDIYVLNADGSGLRSVGQGTLIDWVDENSLGYGSFPGEDGPFGSTFRLHLLDGSVTPTPFSLAVAPDGAVVRDFVWSCETPKSLVIQTRDGRETDPLRGRIPGLWSINDAAWLWDGSGLVFTVTRQDVCT